MGVRRFAALALLLALGACAGLPPAHSPPTHSPPMHSPPGDAQSVTGAGFVARACAGCHAVGRQGKSPDPAAPPFRLLATRLPDTALSADLARVAEHGHVQMPPIYMTGDEQADVLAYLKRLRLAALPRA